MITISLCMIVKDEEAVIARCLDSVKELVDEINIVDTGSTDSTKEILQQYTNRIFDFEWIDHFAAARNYSFQQATKDYILWLDADDIFAAGDIIDLYYESNGLTIGLNLGGSNSAGMVWSCHRIS